MRFALCLHSHTQRQRTAVRFCGAAQCPDSDEGSGWGQTGGEREGVGGVVDCLPGSHPKIFTKQDRRCKL